MNWRDITHPQAGGAEVHIHEVSKRWVKLGHEVTLFCGKYEGCKEDDEIDGIEIIRRGGPFTVYLHAVKEYLWNLRKRDYDIVIDDINGVPFFTPLYVGRPKIAIMHHLVKDIFFKELPWHKAVLGYTAEKMLPLVYYKINFITVSDSSGKDLIKLGISKENVNIVHNGIDHEIYRPNANLKSPYPNIIYLGRIKQYKNLDNLLRAMKIIVDSKQLNDVKLTIAGRGNYEDLIKIVDELKLNNYVNLLGEVSEPNKIELLNRAWIYVTTSTREGWGLTVIEANACGTPSVATDVPGLRDAVVDGKTGFLVPFGDVNVLAEAILEVLTDNELRERLSMNSIEWARQFNWERMATDALRIIEKILGNQHNR